MKIPKSKEITRKKQQNSNKMEAALNDYLKDNPVAQRIGSSQKAMKKYQTIYNVLCDDCRNFCVRSGGRVDIDSYCFECQCKVLPILEEIAEIVNP